MNRRLSQLLHLVRVLPKPGAVQAFRTWKPFSLTSFEMMHALTQQGFAFRTVIDGGANQGQFARAAAETWPDARIYSFEPLPEVGRVLEANLASLKGRVRISHAALGPQEGTLHFYQTPYSLASSALKPEGPYTEIEVPVLRLDDALAGEPLEGPLLLKLDLQGYELPALDGAPNTLARADAVLLETAFRSGYEGEPLFREVLAYMEAKGFRFLRPLDTLLEGTEIVQMDALFVPIERNK